MRKKKTGRKIKFSEIYLWLVLLFIYLPIGFVDRKSTRLNSSHIH